MAYTIKDIARMANVSIATVSRVVNHTGPVAKKTEKRVQDAMKELDYVPNNAARSLVTKSSKIIGVVVADILNPFYAEIIRAVQDRAEEQGYSVISCNTDEDIEKEKLAIQTLLQNQVSGIIMAGGRGKGSYYDEHIIELSKRIPLVLADEYLEAEHIYSVVCNKSKGAYEAVRYLIGLGHEKIAMITGYADYKPSIEKVKGYKKALKEAGIVCRDEYLKYGDYHMYGGSQNLKQLMNLKEPPTAIFTANDLMAMGAIRELNELGYRVPEDISIIGFDDIIMNAYMVPPLTSVKQEMTKIGHLSVEILNQLFKGEAVKKKKTVIEPTLVIRSTCAERKK